MRGRVERRDNIRPDRIAPANRLAPNVAANGTADLVRFGAGLRIECGSCGAARTVEGLRLADLAGLNRCQHWRGV